MLNRNDTIPLYVQLYHILRQQILNGEFKEMDLLPSETQLMDKYKITRTTIRKAIQQLKQEGFVQQVHGKGTYVRLRESQDTVWNFKGFSDLAISQNKQSITKVLEKEIYQKDGNAYMKLVRLRGLQSVNKEKAWMTIDTSHLSLTLFPGLENHDFSTTSLYELMRNKYNINPHYASLVIDPIISTDYMQAKLELKDKTALLKSSGSIFTEKDVLIEKLEIIYSSKFKFKLAQYIDN